MKQSNEKLPKSRDWKSTESKSSYVRPMLVFQGAMAKVTQKSGAVPDAPAYPTPTRRG